MSENVFSRCSESYMASIRRYPVLSREEERRWTEEYAKNGSRRAFEKLVTANLKFVVKICNKYKGYGLPFDDLVQEGNIGLVKAVEKFDPSKGYRLISYAVWWIKAYIQSFVLRSWSLVKLGSTQNERRMFFKLRSTQSRLEYDVGRNGEDISETLARALSVSEKELKDFQLRLAARDFSLDARLEEGSMVTFLDRLKDNEPNPEELAGKAEQSRSFAKSIKTVSRDLSNRELYILSHRLLSADPKTLSEIAKVQKISRERVRQVELQVKEKIKRQSTKVMAPLCVA